MKLDLLLYLIMAVTTAAGMSLNSDEAAKYVAPAQLFWCRMILGIIDGTATTLKGVTSRSFVEWRAEKRAARLNGNGHGHEKGN